MGPVLSNQLQSVIQEELLDSLLPYLVQDKQIGKVSKFRIIFTEKVLKAIMIMWWWWISGALIRFRQLELFKIVHSFFQPPDLSYESDTPSGSNLFPMPSLTTSRHGNTTQSRRNSNSRIILSREHTREEKTPRAEAEKKWDCIKCLWFAWWN